MTALRPFLMFQGKALEAIHFYVALFPDGKIIEMAQFGPGEPGAEGAVKKARIVLAGQEILCIDSPVKHAFSFTPSVSLFVDCRSEDEIDRLDAALSEGGTHLMPLGNHGFGRKFAWLNDRFGVSWQLNLA